MKIVVTALGFVLAAAGAAMACPDTSLEAGQTLEVTGADLAAGVLVDVAAGGGTDLSQCAGEVVDGSVPVGFVMDQPDLRVFVSSLAATSIVIAGAAECDAVLLVNNVDGSWYFNDDSGESLDPAIIIDGAADGQLDIWFGTIGPDACAGSLVLTAAQG